MFSIRSAKSKLRNWNPLLDRLCLIGLGAQVRVDGHARGRWTAVEARADQAKRHADELLRPCAGAAAAHIPGKCAVRRSLPGGCALRVRSGDFPFAQHGCAVSVTYLYIRRLCSTYSCVTYGLPYDSCALCVVCCRWDEACTDGADVMKALQQAMGGSKRPDARVFYEASPSWSLSQHGSNDGGLPVDAFSLLVPSEWWSERPRDRCR